MIMVIRGTYFCSCDSGDRELTLITVIVMISGAYCSYYDSDDRGAYCSYL